MNINDTIFAVTDQAIVLELKVSTRELVDLGSDNGEANRFTTELVSPTTGHAQAHHRTYFKDLWDGDVQSKHSLHATREDADAYARNLCLSKIEDLKAETERWSAKLGPVRYLHTVERTNYEWDDSYREEVECGTDVIAVFDRWADARDYAKIHAGVRAVECGIIRNPAVPEHPEGCVPFSVTYNSVTDTFNATRCNPNDVDNVLHQVDTITDRQPCGLVTQKVGRDGTVVRFQATEEVVVGHKLRYTCWAENHKFAEVKFLHSFEANRKELS